jgi:hypothetical protein
MCVFLLSSVMLIELRICAEYDAAAPTLISRAISADHLVLHSHLLLGGWGKGGGGQNENHL